MLAALESQRSLYATEDQLVQSDRAMTVNLIGLYKALGGWDAAPALPRGAAGKDTKGERPEPGAGGLGGGVQ